MKRKVLKILVRKLVVCRLLVTGRVFYSTTLIFQLILPWMHENIPGKFLNHEEKLIAAFGMISFNMIITILYNTVMVRIYRIKHPFFERFRVNQV